MTWIEDEIVEKQSCIALKYCEEEGSHLEKGDPPPPKAI